MKVLSEQIFENNKKKIELINKSISTYLISTIFAGIFIGFGVGLASKVGFALMTAQSPMIALIPGLVFSVALISIVALRLDLFTSACMYMVIQLIKGSTWLDLVKVLVACYIGNLIGSLMFSYTMGYTGLFEGNSYLIELASRKVHTSFLVLFINGIYCNILVCAGVLMARLTNNDVAKILFIVVAVVVFFSLGYEHSIANMSLIHSAMLVSDTITYADYIYNLVPVTLGNIIGGFIVGAGMYYINRLS